MKWLGGLGFLLAFTGAPQERYESIAVRFGNALRAGDQREIEMTGTALIAADPARAARDLVKELSGVSNYGAYWTIVALLAEVRPAPALEVLREAILSRSTPAPLKRDLFVSLQLNEAFEADAVIVSLLERGDDEIKILAMEEGAKRMSRDVAGFLASSAGALEKRGGELWLRTLRVLQALTDKTFRTGKEWEEWWNENKGSFEVVGKRKARPAEVPPAAPDKQDPDPHGGSPHGELPINPHGGPPPKKPDQPSEKKPDSLEGMLRGTTSREFEDLRRAPPEEIVVVLGRVDQIDQILADLKIPHTPLERKEIDKFDLSRTRSILVNCDGETMNPFTETAKARIREFVSGGGSLFVTERALKDILEPCFRGYVRQAGMTAEIEERYAIYPERGTQANALMKDVFLATALEYEDKAPPSGGTGLEEIRRKFSKKKKEFIWTLDPAQYLCEIDPARVEVLCVAPGLAKYGASKSAVAVTFFPAQAKLNKVVAFGAVDDTTRQVGGRVLYTIGHLVRQKDPKDDAYALQKLLINFLIEARARSRK